MLNPSKFLFQPFWENRQEFYELALKYSTGLEIVCFAMPNILNDSKKLSERLSVYKEELPAFSGTKSLHGAFIDVIPHSPDSKVVALARDRIIDSMDTAASLQCTHVVFHTGINMLIGNADYYARVVDTQASFWRKILDEYSSLNVCLENMWELRPEILINIVQRVNDPRLRLCLDLGHANVFGETSPLEWAKELAAIAPYMHWNDNLGDRDSELPLGSGIIDWPKMVKLVTDLPEHPFIVLEVGEIDCVLKSLSFLEERSLVVLK